MVEEQVSAGQPTAKRQEPVELTTEEALAMAVDRQRTGDFDIAGRIYDRVLELIPDHPIALHFSGVLAQQLGRHSEAVERIGRSLALSPDEADWHSNYAIALKSCQRLEEAKAACERAIALDPTHARAYNNLGLLLSLLGQPAEAEASFRKALELLPFADALQNLGVLLRSQGRDKEGLEVYCDLLARVPLDMGGRRRLILGYCALERREDAIKVVDGWLAETPDDPLALHTAAALKRENVPERASDEYVVRTFDSFAASFEAALARLSYKAPQLVGDKLAEVLPAPAADRDILDAGCGTGLCGSFLKPYARRLTGIDLSAGMMEQAAEKGLYDELIKTELTQYLREHPDSYDVVVSADTLCYFGALDAAVAAAASALRPGGHLIFTVEHAKDESAPDFRIEPHGRFSHSRPYVERLLRANGFDLDVSEHQLRTEGGSPVHGLLVCGNRRG